MGLAKRYNPSTSEPRLQEAWQAQGIYRFSMGDERPIYSIDTPPPTVSGHLHLGHVFSYSHTDFMARFRRMRGYNVFYPMGFDDNGLPTERLVERREGVRAAEIGRRAFIERCLKVSEEAEQEYEALWRRLGLSVDWRFTYRTIDDASRRIAQWSFIDLYRKGLVYRQQAPAIWCPTCATAIAQAEVDDLERSSRFYALAFELEDGEKLPIATTRPELLPACVAVFVHPDDRRAGELVGRQARVPLFGQTVPILADADADPEKGTGVVMCCTFGDQADVAWWYTHELPLVEAIDREGRLMGAAGAFAGTTATEARPQIVDALREGGWLLDEAPISQTVRVHERCDTPVEYIVAQQWFVRVLDFKEAFVAAGEGVGWHPAHMGARYRQWVENLGWDWCISRQRAFGVPFPVWYCDECGAVVLASEEELPVNPMEQEPERSCPACGGRAFRPETDVMDTWATSSLSPQIAGRMFDDPAVYERVFPFSLRPQAHEIIRTWAFYTIVKSCTHFDALPWADVTISGWALAPEGTGKISKSRGGGPEAPLAMIERTSADAVRYWAASTGFGKDSLIDEDKIQAGSKLITKLWNVARFGGGFIEGYVPGDELPDLSLADRWILSRLQKLTVRATKLFESYDYASAKSETGVFFWRDLADNYLEMAKKRLYDSGEAAEGARYALYHALLTTLKLFAPFLPYVTEAIYQGLFDEDGSIHRSQWPEPDERLLDEAAEAAGEALVGIATAVRRYKSEHNLSLGGDLGRLQLVTDDLSLATALAAAEADVMSVTRARVVEVVEQADSMLELIEADGAVGVAVAPA